MKKGFYTDKDNNVLGYFELENIPENTDSHKYYESEDRPPVYISDSERKDIRKRQIVSELNANDLKAIRALAEGDTVRLTEHKNKQNVLRQELQGL